MVDRPDASAHTVRPGAEDGYREARHGWARTMVWEDAAEWSHSVLETGMTLHQWAAQQDDRLEFSGRGLVYAVPAPLPGPDRRSRWAVRHYRRGGAMERALEDRYLRGGRPRPFRELTASVTARARGVRSPAVIAGVTYADGIHYRCDLVTEVVPQATTLAEALHEHAGTRAWGEAMAAAGDLIGQMASAGILHADLNAHNILLTEADRGAWVIDLDRARILSKSSPLAAQRMRARLVRSVVKIGTLTGERPRESDVAAALMGGTDGAR